MKVLKIDDKKCYFSIDGINYTSIVDITKEDVYSILSIIYNTENFIIDEVKEDTEIVNDVEKIIYTNIFNQLKTFIQNKPTLKAEIEDELKEVNEKYQLDKEDSDTSIETTNEKTVGVSEEELQPA